MGSGQAVADLFGGVGGFTEAAEQVGLEVKYAANHWPIAVDYHRRNHPHVHHECQDLRQADFTLLPPIDGLVASPACQGHSEASRSKRRSKHVLDRATAWAVIDCAEVTSPRWLVVENVLPFRRWKLYAVWLEALRTIGYAVSEYALNAADFGVPQDRKRVFVIGVRGKRPHKLAAPDPKWIRRPMPSSTILDPAAGGWELVADKSIAIRERVERGRINHGRTFLTQYVTNHPGRSLDMPIATVTTASAHWHLVDGRWMRKLTVRELARAQSFRDSYILPDEISIGTKLVGNAVPPPMAAHVLRSVASC